MHRSILVNGVEVDEYLVGAGYLLAEDAVAIEELEAGYSSLLVSNTQQGRQAKRQKAIRLTLKEPQAHHV